MKKHTPGPWVCVNTSNHAHDYRLLQSNGRPLPFSAPANDHSEARANARLIAAAPDMLELLRALVDPDDDYSAFHINTARALIRRIDGDD
jgi:hypothetical protein